MIVLEIDGKKHKLITSEELIELKSAIEKLIQVLKEEKTYPEDLFDRFLKEVEKW